MMKRLLAGTVVLLVMTGCQEQKQTVTTVAAGTDQLIYSYPIDGESQAPVSAPVLLHFSTAVSNEDPAGAITLQSLGNGESLPFEARRLSGGRSLMLVPEQPLRPGQRYRVRAEGLRSEGNPLSFPSRGITFATAAAVSGPLSEQLAINAVADTEDTEAFSVLQVIPDGERFPITDFSSLRLRFTEPLSPASVRYGDSLTLTGPNGLVAAEVYASGHNLTLDPEPKLEPGKEYRLSFSSDIASTLGGTLQDGFEFRFVPKDSETEDLLPLQVISDREESRRSILTEQPLNSVLLSSALLGPDNRTFIGRPDPGELANHVFFDLASVVRFPQVTPLQVVRDTRLTGTNVSVRVAGEQPAGLESGEIDVRFLTDANGFLVENPYSSSIKAPKILLLFADLTLNTGEVRANGALSQSLLNVPLIGTVSLEDGVITIDVVAVIAPEILGLDPASGLISFRLKGYESPADGPSPADFLNLTAPSVRTTTVSGEAVDRLRPGDPLLLYFSEPVKGRSAREGIRLTETQSQEPVPFELQSDGAVVSLLTAEPLRHGTDYRLVADGVEDLSGNALSVPFEQDFRLAETETGTATSQSPLVLSAYPGFPCARGAVDPGAESRFQGRCLGGRMVDDDVPDDPIPILDHPGDRPITVRFSQNMDPDTLVPGESVTMETLTDSGWQPFEDWQLKVAARQIQLVPLNRWETGRLYRYSLHSDGENSANAIRSSAGLPLQTRILNQSPRDFDARDYGGPVMTNHFRGAGVSGNTLTPLRNLPANDANGDLVLNEGVEFKVPPTENGGSEFSAIANSAQIQVTNLSGAFVNDARIGCDPGGTDCPQDKFLYLNGMLDVDIAREGLDTLENNPVPVFVYPSMLYTTGEAVHIDTDAGTTVAPTGPMAMRLRYNDDGNGRQRPIPGLLAQDPDSGELEIALSLDVYLDAPYLEVRVSGTRLDHNVYSLPLNNLALEGPVSFLDDGRMEIALSNPEPVDILVRVDGLAGFGESEVTLTIPAGELELNYLSPFTR
ncbi:MAG: Ig-like domain-containing protein [Oleiphilaceae bacterium]|nr:Ig-like domain-containing protein [Oleiphilaceae bacterium]